MKYHAGMRTENCQVLPTGMGFELPRDWSSPVVVEETDKERSPRPGLTSCQVVPAGPCTSGSARVVTVDKGPLTRQSATF